jgi:hypothetical protein
MFEPFQNLMIKAAGYYGISKEMQAAKICTDFKKLIPALFDPQKSPQENVSPAYYKNSTLVINVKSQAWAQEIIMRKEKIIEEMNKKAGETVIKNLRAQLYNG